MHYEEFLVIHKLFLLFLESKFMDTKQWKTEFQKN